MGSGRGDMASLSGRHSVRRSSRPALTEAMPLGVGGVARQVGLFEAANGLPHDLAAAALGIALMLVALLE